MLRQGEKFSFLMRSLNGHIDERSEPQILKTDADYAELFGFYNREILPKQGSKLNVIIELGKKKRVALLCFEKDKVRCHRGIVSRELEKQGILVKHL